MQFTLARSYILTAFFVALIRHTVNASPFDTLNKTASTPIGSTSRLVKRASQANNFYQLFSISQSRDTDLSKFPIPGAKDISELNQTPNDPIYPYDYDDSAGEGSTVYVIDSGAFPEVEEYKSLAKEPEWLFPQTTPRINPDLDKYYENKRTDPILHGHCSAMLIASKTYGVAKRAQLVIVKAAPDIYRGPKGGVDWRTPYLQNHIEALELVWKDFQEKKRKEEDGTGPPIKGKAIVYLSTMVWPKEEFDPMPKEMCEAYKKGVENLTKMAPVYIPAGNQKSNKKGFDQYPHIWAKEMPGLGIVSAANFLGYPASFTNWDEETTTLWAIGQWVTCPAPRGPVWVSGTSEAGPLAAGNAAYLVGFASNGLPTSDGTNDEYAVGVLERQKRMSWVRTESPDLKLRAMPLISNQPLRGCSPPTFTENCQSEELECE